MKIRLLFTIAGLAIGFVLPTFAQQTNTPDPQLREQILRLVTKFDPAFNNGDASALASFYTEDAVLVVPEGPVYGGESIVKSWADLFQKVHFARYPSLRPSAIGQAVNRCLQTHFEDIGHAPLNRFLPGPSEQFCFP